MRISHFFIDRPIFAAVISVDHSSSWAASSFLAPADRAISRDRAAVRSTSPASIRAPAPKSSPRPWSRRSSSRSTASRTCSTCRRTRPPTAASRSRSASSSAPISTSRRCRCRTASPSRSRACRRMCAISASRCSKASPDLMMVVHLYSPDKSRDTLFISNYATLRSDRRAHPRRRRRLDHRVRRARLCDAGLARSRPAAVARTDRERRHQRAARPEHPGRIRHARSAAGRKQPGAFQISVRTLGRLADPEEFDTIVVKQTPSAVVRLKDVARVELAAQDYSSNSYLDHDPAVALADLPAPRLQRAGRPRRPCRDRWRSSRSASRPASNTPSSTIRRSSSRSRSTP